MFSPYVLFSRCVARRFSSVHRGFFHCLTVNPGFLKWHPVLFASWKQKVWKLVFDSLLAFLNDDSCLAEKKPLKVLRQLFFKKHSYFEHLLNTSLKGLPSSLLHNSRDEIRSRSRALGQKSFISIGFFFLELHLWAWKKCKGERKPDKYFSGLSVAVMRSSLVHFLWIGILFFIHHPSTIQQSSLVLPTLWQ